jgi:hypothetical protein
VISAAAGRDDREDHADAERKPGAQDDDSRELTKEQRQHRHDEHREDPTGVTRTSRTRSVTANARMPGALSVATQLFQREVILTRWR